jgi:hypothetical protein
VAPDAEKLPVVPEPGKARAGKPPVAPGATATVVRTCPKFLALLGAFYEDRPEAPPTRAELIDPSQIPEPFRRMLVHKSDMTSTLEKYHGEPLELLVLDRAIRDGFLFRHIVLAGRETGQPVEYGAIRIALTALGEEARREVIECRIPLGRILVSHGVTHVSCPGGFFQVHSNALMNRVLKLDGPRWLYGRCNCLSDASGRVLAEVVEILPNRSQS